MRSLAPRREITEATESRGNGEDEESRERRGRRERSHRRNEETETNGFQILRTQAHLSYASFTTLTALQTNNPVKPSGVRLADVNSMLVKLPFHNETRDIIGAAIEVHRVLGLCLLESAYSKCLQHELSARQMAFVAQRRVPLVYKGVSLDFDYRLDLLVKGVVVEVKALDTLAPIHQAQLLTDLRLAGLPVGLVINFNVDQLVKGIKRVINPRANEADAVRLPP